MSSLRLSTLSLRAILSHLPFRTSESITFPIPPSTQLSIHNTPPSRQTQATPKNTLRTTMKSLRAVRRFCSSTATPTSTPLETPTSSSSLGWTDRETAAYIQTSIVPSLPSGHDAAVGRLTEELEKLRALGCSVWTESWAAAIAHFTPKTKRKASVQAKDAAQKLFDNCVVAGIEPDASIYQGLVSVQQRYIDCRVVFDFMVLDGTTPDEDCVLGVLRMCRRYNTTSRHKAESLMTFLEHEGVVPTQRVWNEFLSIYAAAGDLPGASGVLLRMKACGATLDEKTFTTFVTCCANSPNMTESFGTAEMAIAQSYKLGIPMSSLGMAKLMKLYRRHESAKRGGQLYATAEKQGKVSSELLWHYSFIVAKGDTKWTRKALRKSVKSRFLKTLRQAAAQKPNEKVQNLLKNLIKKRARKAIKRTKKTKDKTDGIDLIGAAIKKHLARKTSDDEGTSSTTSTSAAAPKPSKVVTIV